MSNVDDIIRERLNKLRNETQTAASEPSSSLPPSAAAKSSVEQVEFLLKQLSAHTELEEKSRNERLDVDSQIRRRLEKLKVESSKLDLPAIKSRSSVRVEPMEDVPPPPSSVDDLASDASDSSETCVMCEAPPTLVCSGCYDDLYCRSCFADSHDPGENHVSRPIRKRD